jgi:hypothetical protein
MAKKKSAPKEYVPYRNNPYVYVYYELEFGKDVIKPGDKIKIKFDRDTYTFLRLAHHSKHDTTWVDCISLKKGSWHSFRVEDVQRVIRPKRSRRKKIGN